MTIATMALDGLEQIARSWRILDRLLRTGAYADIPDADFRTLTMHHHLENPQRLQTVPLLWVSPEMCDLLEHASATLPPTPFEPEALPWDDAVTLFARPIRASGDNVDGVTWAPIKGHAEGMYMLCGLRRYVPERTTTPLMSLDIFTFVRPGSMIESLPHWGGDSKPLEDADRWHRLLSTLWLLVQQRVAVRRRVFPQRADVRRWDRTHDTPIPEVTIIELRRPLHTSSTNDDEHGDVEWSHRWIVDGHWRNQWHPSLNAHVPTWIAPHIKGPEDKPLVVKRKINAWVR